MMQKRSTRSHCVWFFVFGAMLATVVYADEDANKRPPSAPAAESKGIYYIFKDLFSSDSPEDARPKGTPNESVPAQSPTIIEHAPVIGDPAESPGLIMNICAPLTPRPVSASLIVPTR